MLRECYSSTGARQLCAFIHNFDIPDVTEQPVAFPLGKLADDAQTLQMA